MNDTTIETETPEAKSKRLKRERDARYKAKKKEPLKAQGEKRLTGLLKVHGATDAEVSEALKLKADQSERDRRKLAKLPTPAPVEPDDEKIIVREPRPKMSSAKRTRAAEDKAKGIKRKAVAEGIEVTMGRTYQREGNVAAGLSRSGAKQLAIMFPVEMFDKLAKLAKRQGISVSEQVRQFVAQGLVNL